MTDCAAIRVRAHAKINLNLRVLGRRPDGYHDLRTVFQALALHDTLTFTRRPGPFVIECADAGVPLDRGNLVWRAADALWKHVAGEGEPGDLAVRVDKRIPVQAGLGGGSADAAATLVGLARLWRADLSSGVLDTIAAGIGADVPFFLTGGAALGLGRGDEMRSLPDLPPTDVLLVLPPFGVSTADAYRWCDEMGPLAPPPAPTIPHCPWPPPDCELANDFQPVVSARHPEVQEIVRTLLAAGASAAAMTGSGSTIFGLFDGDDACARAERVVSDAGHRTIRTRTLARRGYAAESAPACL